MPNFNHKGPENLGAKTGMKLGKCNKTTSDMFEYPLNRPFGKGRRKKSTSHKLILTNFKKNEKDSHTNHKK